jgi:hypothetical protein
MDHRPEPRRFSMEKRFPTESTSWRQKSYLMMRWSVESRLACLHHEHDISWCILNKAKKSYTWEVPHHDTVQVITERKSTQHLATGERYWPANTIGICHCVFILRDFALSSSLSLSLSLYIYIYTYIYIYVY